MPPTRKYTVRYTGSPPKSVTINGASGAWRFDGKTGQVVVSTGPVSTKTTLNIVVVPTVTPSEEGPFFGLKGMLSRANLAKRTLDPSWSTPGSQIVQVSVDSRLFIFSISLDISSLACCFGRCSFPWKHIDVPRCDQLQQCD